jgi:hypothetical protein
MGFARALPILRLLKESLSRAARTEVITALCRMRIGNCVEIETVEHTPKIAVGGLFAVSTGFDDAIVAEITQRPEHHIVVFDRRPFLRRHDGGGTAFEAALRGREQTEDRVIR